MRHTQMHLHTASKSLLFLSLFYLTPDEKRANLFYLTPDYKRASLFYLTLDGKNANLF